MQVDDFDRVVVAAGDDAAQWTEQVEGFELVEDEGEDAVIGGHFVRFSQFIKIMIK